MELDLHGNSYKQYVGGYKIAWNGKIRQLRLLKDRIGSVDVLDTIDYQANVTDKDISQQVKLWEGLILKLSRKCYYCSREAEYEMLNKFACGICIQAIADESECSIQEFERYKFKIDA